MLHMENIKRERISMSKILEPAREIPVIEEADICVIGGSCTGVFAAVRAARLGAKVVLIEKQNSFGGVATSSLVNVWHSIMDTEKRKQIIAGLSTEIIDKLKTRDAVEIKDNVNSAFRLNTEELKIELDKLVKEAGIKPYLHTIYVSPYLEDDSLSSIIIENKSGRSAIKAKYFIDATGDGDLCRDLDLEYKEPAHIQPPTSCAKIYGKHTLADFNWQKAICEYGKEFGLEEDWGWNTTIPGVSEAGMYAETHVFDVNCAKGDELTYSEMEGRRQVRAIMDIARKYGPDKCKLVLLGLPSYIGIRETYHVVGKYRLTEEDILTGKRFDDAIANGTYRVDIHHDDCAGITFRYLDGTEEIFYGRSGKEKEVGRWREEIKNDPTFYQIPYRSLLPDKYENLLFCGRMIDAERGAFGAIRVMINMNQTGEAAGVASYLALNGAKAVQDVDSDKLRITLKTGGSIIK